LKVSSATFYRRINAGMTREAARDTPAMTRSESAKLGQSMRPESANNPNSMTARARCAGVKIGTAHWRKKHGWPDDLIFQPRAVSLLPALAHERGLKTSTLWHRQKNWGSLEAAMARPLISGRKNWRARIAGEARSKGSISEQARAHGLRPGFVLQRMRRNGMSLDEALSTPPVTDAERTRRRVITVLEKYKNSILNRLKRATGFHKSTISRRLKAGMSETEIINTPLRSPRGRPQKLAGSLEIIA
jgi:hypothetical protein